MYKLFDFKFGTKRTLKICLVSLFTGIPTFVNYLIPRPSYKKSSSNPIKLIVNRDK